MLFKPALPIGSSLKAVLAFPSTYSIGITSLGYQVIWTKLAQRRDVDVRRLFTDQGDPQHRNCDLFGLSLSWELDGPILLELLEKQKIPAWSYQRKDNDPIVFGGGPVLTSNPEPMAPFFDVILLGDGEELVSIFIDTMKSIKGLERSKQLIELAKIPGIYVPSLYSPEYDQNGSLIRIKPIIFGIQETIKKQTFNGNILSHSTVITPDSAWPDIHMVEVVRSCPEMCRFCMASYLTLPFRTNSLDEGLIPAVEKGLPITKRIGLLGASVTQHPQFIELMEWLDRDELDGIRLSVSSVRANTINPKISKILAKRGSKSITMAVESGSQRIREVINKKISEEEIYAAARYAQEGGLKGVKLYGMVGLPTEDDDDIESTSNLLLNIKKKTPGIRIILGLSTFVPKAQTPFQWHGVNPMAEQRLKMLTKLLKPKGIDVRPESYNWSLIQALISRGDRRLASVIYEIRNTKKKLGDWKKAYKMAAEGRLDQQNNKNFHLPPPPEWNKVIHEYWNIKTILPWTHLRGPLQPEKLIEHHLLLKN